MTEGNREHIVGQAHVSARTGIARVSASALPAGLVEAGMIMRSADFFSQGLYDAVDAEGEYRGAAFMNSKGTFYEVRGRKSEPVGTCRVFASPAEGSKPYLRLLEFAALTGVGSGNALQFKFEDGGYVYRRDEYDDIVAFATAFDLILREAARPYPESVSIEDVLKGIEDRWLFLEEAREPGAFRNLGKFGSVDAVMGTFPTGYLRGTIRYERGNMVALTEEGYSKLCSYGFFSDDEEASKTGEAC